MMKEFRVLARLFGLDNYAVKYSPGFSSWSSCRNGECILARRRVL